MLKSYLKVALRTFLRDKKYSLINLLGLVTGLASVFIILAYVKYELSFDRYYGNSNRIYRIVAVRTQNDVTEQTVMVPSSLNNTLKKELPDVQAATYLYKSQQQFIINNEPVKFEGVMTDAGFFTVFNLPFKFGNPAVALRGKRTIVISEAAANTYFHGKNPVGSTVTRSLGNAPLIYTITGVFKNIPGNTHFNADIIVATQPFEPVLDWWHGYSAETEYILLNKNASIEKLQQKLASFYKKYNFPPYLHLEFQAVTSIHLHSNIEDEQFANSNIKYVYTFFIVAMFILLIACINNINLTTARSLQRVKEIGVRKVIGAQQRQLALQFITESVLFFCLTAPFALLLAYVAWPLFASILQLDVHSDYLLSIDFISLMVGIAFITGLLSGAYSAFFVSRLRPAHILKDWQKSFAINMRVRKALIVFQFAISVALIVATVIVNNELYLLTNKELGFNKDHLIILPYERFDGKAQAFKNELKKNRNIIGVTMAGWSAGERYGGMAMMQNPGDTSKFWSFSVIGADFDFIKTMQAKLTEGRDFSPQYAGDVFQRDSMEKDPAFLKLSNDEKNSKLAFKSIIINHELADMIGLKGPIAGKTLKYDVIQGTVIGQVQDFLGVSLLQTASPVAIVANTTIEYGHTYIRTTPQNSTQVIDHIHGVWRKFFPETVFEFSFVDDKLNHLYDAQKRMASIFNIFSSLAIVIALLGLFSLVALTIQQKTKEIGIRKILGASINDIVQLLSKDYVKLIIIAALIATPAVWWAMNKWLQDFTYRVTIHWWLFIAIPAGCLLLALLSIILQTIKVAKANPVDSLRSE